MTEKRTWIELVSQARLGRRDAMGLLAQKAAVPVRAYVYRVTLDSDLAEDLSQEVLLQMVKSLDDLHEVEHFWPWLYRIAQSKIKQHYKAKRRRLSLSDTAFYRNFAARRNLDYQNDGLREVVQKELSKKVMLAMKRIKQQYRAVLSLRCFEQLSYADIALAMDCSEVGARVLFFRAKQALKKQLNHQGLKKGVLLACIGLFGRLTAPAEAASSTVTVSAATAEVGLTATILGTAGSKAGVAAVVVIAATLAGIGGLSLFSSEPPPPITPSPMQRADVRSLHFTMQLQNPDPNATTSLSSKGAYEHWFYLPDGVDGPLLMRMQRWNPQQTEKLCSWLQDAQANYYFDSGLNRIHISNCRVCWSNLRVRRLPTDSKEFIDFLSLVEGDAVGFSAYTRDPNTSLLTSLVDYRFVNAPQFETDYQYNTVDEEQFRYDWPADIPVVDERDPMHKRGWTYFRLSGNVGGQALSGRGCIPFFYDAAKAHPAWMILNVGNMLQVADSQKGAHLRRVDGKTVAYPSGTFFKGLARPWMGLHAADVVRRDAVEERIWFKSEGMDNKDYVAVTVLYESEGEAMDLIYAVDMENDMIRDIKFMSGNEPRGSLIFSYLQDVDDLGDKFTEPVVPTASKAPCHPTPGILWLVHLAEGDLDKQAL
jgi:RNA polymerase sigma-70 factor (ECF subfamily)